MAAYCSTIYSNIVGMTDAWVTDSDQARKGSVPLSASLATSTAPSLLRGPPFQSPSNFARAPSPSNHSLFQALRPFVDAQLAEPGATWQEDDLEARLTFSDSTTHELPDVVQGSFRDPTFDVPLGAGGAATKAKVDDLADMERLTRNSMTSTDEDADRRRTTSARRTLSSQANSRQGFLSLHHDGE